MVEREAELRHGGHRPAVGSERTAACRGLLVDRGGPMVVTRYAARLSRHSHPRVAQSFFAMLARGRLCNFLSHII
jgi:hypothetical protein